MTIPFLPNSLYKFLFALLGLVYIIGLFVPLVDNDSAHHASIALRMHLTGDYVSLIDQGGDYLDKPHLLFWLAAMSFKVFGVTGFAYKIPSLLFTILGTFSVYRVGVRLYGKEVGKLAALIVASAFAYILANNDVRMDAILTTSIAFATWQLTAFVDTGKLLPAAGAALGLALGFSTKGHIAVFVPAITTLFYIAYRKDWKILLNWRWLVLIFLFALLISPVVYAYYLQYNLHPEKVVRGKNNIDGVSFILFNQSISRFSGEMGGDAKNDYLFFFHSFLWAFAPWSILAYMAIVNRIRHFSTRKEEWATTGVFLCVALLVSASGFKLPHYLNVIFPTASVMTAAFIIRRQGNIKAEKTILTIQLVQVILLLLLSIFINAWAFPVKSVWIIIVTVFLLAIVFYFMKSTAFSRLQKAVAISVSAMALVFFMLNSSFYPQLLKYQAGKQLAKLGEGNVNPADVYVRPNSYSASYTFYSGSIVKPFHDSLLASGRNVWLLTEPGPLEEFRKEGYQTGREYSAVHYRVTKLDLKFMNPEKRDQETWKMMLVEVLSKK
ncbi:MAG: glycosyltransferase family 39 protein [Chitinophagaceae bacterium]|nr:glycosyltransferase family 39 protein [Chitinophagaceae bacterium]